MEKAEQEGKIAILDQVVPKIESITFMEIFKLFPDLPTVHDPPPFWSALWFKDICATLNKVTPCIEMVSNFFQVSY